MFGRTRGIAFLILSSLSAAVLCADVLRTNGYSTCLDDSDITVERLVIEYDRLSQVITFDVAGRNKRSQNVTASLNVTAYGKEVYQRDFDPCVKETFVEQLCPGKLTTSGLLNQLSFC